MTLGLGLVKLQECREPERLGRNLIACGIRKVLEVRRFGVGVMEPCLRRDDFPELLFENVKSVARFA
jgi:hypothetical protein